MFAMLLSSCGMLRPAKDGEKVTTGMESGTTVGTTAEITTEETTAMTEKNETSDEVVITTEEITVPPVTTAATEAVTEPVITTVTEPPVTTTEPPVTTTPPPETTTAAPVPPPADGVTSKGYTITVVDGITYVDGTLIANKTYPLPDTYNPAGLTSDTYAAFIEMQSAASAAGHYIYVRSGFRSYIDQKIIYADYAARDGQAAADRYSARAGHSEHQSGMAIDVNETTYAFGETPAGIWLRENCHKYGFIIRYPEGKEHITGYMYEPWHIRYVGVDLAEKVNDSGLTLEEYFGITSAYAE